MSGVKPINSELPGNSVNGVDTTFSASGPGGAISFSIGENGFNFSMQTAFDMSFTPKSIVPMPIVGGTGVYPVRGRIVRKPYGKGIFAWDIPDYRVGAHGVGGGEALGRGPVTGDPNIAGLAVGDIASYFGRDDDPNFVKNLMATPQINSQLLYAQGPLRDMTRRANEYNYHKYLVGQMLKMQKMQEEQLAQQKKMQEEQAAASGGASSAQQAFNSLTEEQQEELMKAVAAKQEAAKDKTA